MKRAYKLIDQGDHWIIPLQGRSVTRCFVDSAFGIELWTEENSFTIRIEVAFLFGEMGKQHSLSPEEPMSLCPVFSILYKEISSVLASKKGNLHVAFSDGAYLSVDANPDYEAWDIFGSTDLRIISLPGGDLGIWESAGDTGNKLPVS